MKPQPIFGIDHSLLISGEGVPNQIGHGVSDERCGIGQELELPRRIKAVNGTQQADAALLLQIVHVDVQVAALQRRTPVYYVSSLHNEAHILFNKKLPRGPIALLSQGAKPLIGQAGRIHRLPPCRSWDPGTRAPDTWRV